MGKGHSDSEVLRLNHIINKGRKSDRQTALGKIMTEFEIMAGYPNRNAQKNGRNKLLEIKGPGLE